MTPLRIPSHWTDDFEQFAKRLIAPPRLLVGCDFDGTLAPLVGDPGAAALPASTRAVLRSLEAAPGISLAVISGRSLADVMTRVSLNRACFAGNHGLEISGHGLDGVNRRALALQPRLSAMADVIDRRLSDLSGLRVENKLLSLSVHYRQVNPEYWDQVTRTVSTIVAQDGFFRLQAGHCVVEILPSLCWDKGDALKQIAGRLGIPYSSVFYVGDDTTDEAAFHAVAKGTTVSVGDGRPSAARWMARDTNDVRHLLAWVGALRR